MRTAIDTNVLSALWSKKPSAADIARILGNAKAEGDLVVSAPVYAELLAYPKAAESFVNGFLADTGIAVDCEFEKLVWVTAGRRFARYAKRRRRSAREGPKRLLADFIIGSHALARADRFMTLDPKRYARDFPDLKLIGAASIS
jgi:predicted nucleic acid-binding protein